MWHMADGCADQFWCKQMLREWWDHIHSCPLKLPWLLLWWGAAVASCFRLPNKHLLAKLLCPSEFSHSQNRQAVHSLPRGRQGRPWCCPTPAAAHWYCHDFLIPGSAAMNSAAAQTPTWFGSELLLDLSNQAKIKGFLKTGYPQNQGCKCFKTKTV